MLFVTINNAILRLDTIIFPFQYQIGGAFPLHLDDCLTVRPSAVQQLVAVQWALSYWNQIPENEKIGSVQKLVVATLLHPFTLTLI